MQPTLPHALPDPHLCYVFEFEEAVRSISVNNHNVAGRRFYVYMLDPCAPDHLPVAEKDRERHGVFRIVDGAE